MADGHRRRGAACSARVGQRERLRSMCLRVDLRVTLFRNRWHLMYIPVLVLLICLLLDRTCFGT